MEILLKYIYTGIIDLDNLSGLKVLNLLIATDELDFRISDRIIKYYDFESKSFIKEDPYEVLHIVFHLNDPFTSLKDVCLHSICENSEMFFKLPKFLTVDKPILKYLLQRDDLVIKEYIILDFLLEWGMAQMSNTVNINNISNWTTNDYNKMREILQELLPLIRWFQIPSALFHNNRQLYKMILPEALFDDIINFYNNPRIIPNSSVLISPRKQSFDPVIIHKWHFAKISNWIDKKETDYYDNRTMPYSFKLIYRSSRDGIDSRKFHELCDDQGPTLLIAKTIDTGELIGGYNPESWKFSATSKDSFLFSFANIDDFRSNSGIIARCLPKKSDSTNNSYGPVFGNRDLAIKNNVIISEGFNSYPEAKPFVNSQQELFIEDYEVFKSISEEYFTYYEYSDFNNFLSIGSGSFGNVIRANWKHSDHVVALKSFKVDKITSENFVNEIKLHKKVDFHPNILRFYGITSRGIADAMKKYSMVLEYADSGTLSAYLNKYSNEMNWNIKFQLALQLASAVECIHDFEIVHRDLHANNILVHQNIIKLEDFGLSKKTAEESKNLSQIFGVLPYVDPKDSANDNTTMLLTIGILKGKRETIIDGTPPEYKCWKYEPDDRPNAQDVVSTLKSITSPEQNNMIMPQSYEFTQSSIAATCVNTSSNLITKWNQKDEETETTTCVNTSSNLIVNWNKKNEETKTTTCVNTSSNLRNKKNTKSEINIEKTFNLTIENNDTNNDKENLQKQINSQMEEQVSNEKEYLKFQQVELEKKEKDLLARQEEIKLEKSRLEQEVKILSQQVESLKTDLIRINTIYQSNEKNINKMENKEKKSLKSEIKQINQKLEDKKDEIEELEGKLNEVSKSISNLKNKIDELNQLKEDFNNKLYGSKVSTANLRKQMDSLNTDIHSKSKKLSNQLKEQKKIKDKLVEVRKNAKTIQEEKDQIFKKKSEIKELELKELIDTVRTELSKKRKPMLEKLLEEQKKSIEINEINGNSDSEELEYYSK
ncbi:1712_t:CDS:10 [Funneliformis geosporum]|nr:1712_t:CDS:10 [Funneliformis geosporum]